MQLKEVFKEICYGQQRKIEINMHKIVERGRDIEVMHMVKGILSPSSFVDDLNNSEIN